MVRFEFESETFWFLSLSLFCLENRGCLSRGVYVAGAVWRGWSHRSGTQWSDGREVW
jgi:hypothetical protein